jgi:hypothetical protein
MTRAPALEALSAAAVTSSDQAVNRELTVTGTAHGETSRFWVSAEKDETTEVSSRRRVLMKFEIPYPLKVEHEKLHETLRRATKERGELGDAASVLATVMHPHFVKEEEYALPPLGLLPDLAHGPVTPDMQDVLALTDRLTGELDQMLAEHKAILAALKKLSAVARRAGKIEYVDFAQALTLHAQTEEEVSYPTAILIGEYIRDKMGSAYLS